MIKKKHFFCRSTPTQLAGLARSKQLVSISKPDHVIDAGQPEQPGQPGQPPPELLQHSKSFSAKPPVAREHLVQVSILSTVFLPKFYRRNVDTIL
jgi:hypothetical protein